MIIYDMSFQSPLENILFDDLLLDDAECGRGDEALRLWESPKVGIVLGRIGKPDGDVFMERCRADGIPVLRRSSGGGTVVQGPGCLNFSFVLSRDKNPALNDLHQSYRVVLDPVIRLLADLGVRVNFQPVSDLALMESDRKISGNAQCRKRRYILHHGTLLYDFDLNLISRYLRFPAQIPDYRAGRSHQEFVANIPVERKVLRDSFLKAFSHESIRVHPDDFLSDQLSKKCLAAAHLNFIL